MKLGIVGSRRRNSLSDFQVLKQRVIELKPEMIISGGCIKGADNFAETIAKEFGIPITIYYPKLVQGKEYRLWEVTQANHARNQLIALNSDRLIALVASDRRGGTENTIGHFKGAKPFAWEDNLEIL